MSLSSLLSGLLGIFQSIIGTGDYSSNLILTVCMFIVAVATISFTWNIIYKR